MVQVNAEQAWNVSSRVKVKSGWNWGEDKVIKAPLFKVENWFGSKSGTVLNLLKGEFGMKLGLKFLFLGLASKAITLEKSGVNFFILNWYN